MQPESCLSTQSPHTPNRSVLTRPRPCGVRGLHWPQANLLQQHHLDKHTSATSVRTVPPRYTTSYATTAIEAPVVGGASDSDRPTNASGHGRQNHKQLALQDSDSQISQLESLRLLEWPELCQQVGHLLRHDGLLACMTTCCLQTCLAALQRLSGCMHLYQCATTAHHECPDTITSCNYQLVCIPCMQ